MNITYTARLRRVLAAIAITSPFTAQAADDGWQVSIGAGVMSRPEYPGSGSSKTQAFPVFNATDGRFFVGAVPGAGPLGAGVYLYQDANWRLGAAVAPEIGKPRKESDDERLHGLGDIDRTTRAGVFASYTLDRFTARAAVFSDAGGKDQGTTATFDLEARFMPVEGLALTAGPGLTWADNDHAKTFFGISAEQSARSGLPAFDAKSGVQSVRFAVGANYQLTRQWSLGARATAAKLRNDAADSPITVDKTQNSFALFAAYRF